MDKDQEVTTQRAPQVRPGWLMPGWLLLTAGHTGRPFYVDARRVTAIEDHPHPDRMDGAKCAVVCVEHAGRCMVAETAEEVMHQLCQVTR